MVKQSDALRLEKLVAVAKVSPRVKMKVEGYSDDMGSPSYNKRLSLKRALVVKNYLVGQGVDAEQIVVRARGPINPVASNLTEEGRAANRRVEVAMLVPFDVAGMVYQEAREIMTAPERSERLERGQKIAVLPFPGGHGPLQEEFKRLMGEEAGLKLTDESDISARVAGAVTESFEQVLALGRKQRLDWLLCAAHSREAEREHLVVELIEVVSGKTVISESEVINAGQEAALVLVRVKERVMERLGD